MPKVCEGKGMFPFDICLPTYLPKCPCHIHILKLSSFLTWARGTDVQPVALAINHDSPLNWENYIHRISHGGCFGHKGVGITIVTKNNQRTTWDMETFYDTPTEG